MKTKAWGGLVTNASPHSVPLGVAVAQENVHNAVPGQLTARGGMRQALCVGDRVGIYDCCAVRKDGVTYLLALSDDGLVALESPAKGDETAAPGPTPVSSVDGSTETNYLMQYSSPDAASQPDPDVGSGDGYVSYLDGGSSGSGPYAYYINANEQCDQVGAESEFNGGSSSLTEWPLALQPSQLCETE